jgi:DNA (cytosine-5)-methyltransferase 1
MNYIDLFAGAGGLSEGFKRAGYEPVAHVEMNEAACFTLKTRVAFHYLKSENRVSEYEAYLKGEITRNELYALVPVSLMNSVINKPIGPETNDTIFSQIDELLDKKDVDLIVGGPPCQAYSLVGRARSANGMKDDPRNFLFNEYAKYLERYNPKVFVFENVLGLRSANKGLYYKAMKSLFNQLGYNIHEMLLNASNYGVLQNRKRIILIGWKKELDLELGPFKTIKYNYSVESVLEDLPALQAGEGIIKSSKYCDRPNQYLQFTGIRSAGFNILTQHIARPNIDRDKEIYKIAAELWHKEKKRLSYIDLPEKLKTHKNRSSFFDRFKVVAPDLSASQTVVAHIAKDGHYYIHPDLKQNRSLTVREAARLQSFPDDFYFEGVKEKANRTAAYMQIGNAVPPVLAYEIAKYVKKKFDSPNTWKSQVSKLQLIEIEK